MRATVQAASDCRISPAKAAHHGLCLAWRGVLKIRNNPQRLIGVVIQPILFLIMFVYLFGGAIAGSTDTYLQMLVPGLMVMVTLMTSFSAGIELNIDVSKGVFDRFRSMPTARSAPLVGAVLADVVRYVVALGVLLIAAVVMGYRIHTDLLAAFGGAALMISAGLCFCWIAVFVGMLVENPSSVQGIMIAFVMPLTFGSNVFVPTSTMPGWLQAWSHISPVSFLADTMRGLLNGGSVGGPLLGGLAWMVGIVGLFFPLAMRAYRRRMR